MVRRYRFDQLIGCHVRYNEGNWVPYEDYEKLRERLGLCKDKLRDLLGELFPEEKMR